MGAVNVIHDGIEVGNAVNVGVGVAVGGGRTVKAASDASVTEPTPVS